MRLSRFNIKLFNYAQKMNFYRHLFLAYETFLCDVFYVFLLHKSDNDPMLKTVFWTASVTALYLKYVNL